MSKKKLTVEQMMDSLGKQYGAICSLSRRGDRVPADWLCEVGNGGYEGLETLDFEFPEGGPRYWCAETAGETAYDAVSEMYEKINGKREFLCHWESEYEDE